MTPSNNGKISVTLVVAMWLNAFGISVASAGTTQTVKEIAQVGTHISQLLKDYTSDQILVIFDVDGTLTNHSTPNGSLVEPRGAAIQLVNSLKTIGVSLVASSAWDSLKETLGRLETLNLVETFDGKSGDEQCSKTVFKAKSTDLDVTVCQTGNIVSVQDANVDSTYFRQKALAPYFALGSRMDTIKKVIFVDDSSGNIRYFKNDVRRLELFSGADIDYFELEAPYSDPLNKGDAKDLFPGLVEQKATAVLPLEAENKENAPLLSNDSSK